MMEGPTTKKHKENAKYSNAAIITLSDTRELETDRSGALIKELLKSKGHTVVEHIVIPDNKEEIKSTILKLTKKDIDIIITDGGTGISKKDVTIEAVRPLFEKEITSFSTLFAQLSYEEIGSAALVSRAIAGVVNKTAIFCVPGSPNACRLALEKLILPEIGHIIKHTGE